MKKIMTMVALAVLMVVTLTACGTSKPPKAEQIKADLIANQANIFNINYTEMSLGVKNVEITKRQTEDIYDEVYVSAQMTDDYYTVNADYVVYYEYFDEGGWCLSGIQLLSYESYAEKFPLTTEQLETIFSSYYSNCKIIE
ncbi:MAG: hypothetical protein IJ339_00620, partial [Oscillospiraceae bacterium]|nr:hypothetical protein [Oscillospiraceae bacterium]